MLFELVRKICAVAMVQGDWHGSLVVVPPSGLTIHMDADWDPVDGSPVVTVRTSGGEWHWYRECVPL